MTKLQKLIQRFNITETDKIINLVGAVRIFQSATVMIDPIDYKVCDGCDCILFAGATFVCPKCSSYRFELDPYNIITKAIELSNKEPTILGLE